MSLLSDILLITLAFSLIAVVISFAYSEVGKKPKNQIKKTISESEHMINETHNKIRGRR